MPTTQDHTRAASNMLDAATSAARRDERGIGHVVRAVPGYGTAIVTFTRASQSYDVGDSARSHAVGRRADVLPALVKLLGRAQ